MKILNKVKDYINLGRSRFKPGELLATRKDYCKYTCPYVYPIDWEKHLSPNLYKHTSPDEYFFWHDPIFVLTFIEKRKVRPEDILLVVEEENVPTDFPVVEENTIWNPYNKKKYTHKVKVLIEDQLYWAHPVEYMRLKKQR